MVIKAGTRLGSRLDRSSHGITKRSRGEAELVCIPRRAASPHPPGPAFLEASLFPSSCTVRRRAFAVECLSQASFSVLFALDPRSRDWKRGKLMV